MNRNLVYYLLLLLMIATNVIPAQQENRYNVYAFPQSKKATIFLSPIPGRVNLSDDLAKIKSNTIKNVIVLVSKEELIQYKVPNLLQQYDSLGIRVFHSPIIDYGLPSVEQMRELLKYIHGKVKANENVLVHCVGGYGRSGTVMGCYAKQYLSKKESDPIQYVRSIRGNDAIETEAQVAFVTNWTKKIR